MVAAYACIVHLCVVGSVEAGSGDEARRMCREKYGKAADAVPSAG